MRGKSARTRQFIDLTNQDQDEARAEPSAYWKADALFEDGRRVAVEERQVAAAAAASPEDYAVLDLRRGATREEIAAAYRNLAKVHHPDRWANADEEIRRHHEACMAAVNRAHEALLRELEVRSP
jgi:DnaJ-class molecular chaperone